MVHCQQPAVPAKRTIVFTTAEVDPRDGEPGMDLT